MMGLLDMAALAVLFVAIGIGAAASKRRRMGIAAFAVAAVLVLFFAVMAGVYAAYRMTRGG